MAFRYISKNKFCKDKESTAFTAAMKYLGFFAGITLPYQSDWKLNDPLAQLNQFLSLATKLSIFMLFQVYFHFQVECELDCDAANVYIFLQSFLPIENYMN